MHTVLQEESHRFPAVPNKLEQDPPCDEPKCGSKTKTY
jgi:hypothetical protein